ncbi:MAG: 4Fe-4S dicluster-binding protein [Candidatus Eisenbacteria bacterium]|nr:4Fe-4S binding protein [Candidatus Eisenbacteria bacterium]
MSHDSYAKLAGALEALPSGFPRMPSGVEIRILEKVFTAEEAELTGHMTRRYEAAADIARRAGVPVARASELLQGLLPRGLVRKRVEGGQEQYRLGPFIVGWYEAAVLGPMRNDLEFANLFRQYMAEGGGDRILSPRPGVMGVVPARGSLKPELLQPYDDIDAHFARHERFGLIDCVCRLESNLFGGTCTKPVKRCGFVGLPPQTPLSEYVLDREQALALFQQLEDEGHVHTGFYGFIMGAETPQFVGCCNCCGDCCGILGPMNRSEMAEGPQRSNYRAVLHREDCIDCGTCVDRCQVHAISQDDGGVTVIRRERCIGCGLCVTTCDVEAIELEPVSKEEWFDVPSSFEEWEERRLAQMGKTA